MTSSGKGVQQPPEILAVDEAHEARNSSTQLFCAIAASPARRLLLTATPCHNYRSDMFNLLSLAVPKVFTGDILASFAGRFKGDMATATRACEEFEQLCSEYLLQRDSSFLTQILPPCHKHLLFVHADVDEQAAMSNKLLHVANLQRLGQQPLRLARGREKTTKQVVFIIFICRNHSCHPFLGKGDLLFRGRHYM